MVTMSPLEMIRKKRRGDCFVGVSHLYVSLAKTMIKWTNKIPLRRERAGYLGKYAECLVLDKMYRFSTYIYSKSPECYYNILPVKG